MENEFYVIQEEFFYEDDNQSSYYILDEMLFSNREEAELYLKNYFNENGFESMEKAEVEDNDYCFIITDGSFPEKYSNEGCTKKFFFEKLNLFK